MRFTRIIQAILLLYLAYDLAMWDESGLARAIIALLLTLVPSAVERRYRMCLPYHVEDLVALSLLISVAGNASGLYESYYFIYDRFAHLIAAVTLGMVVFTTAIIFNRRYELGVSGNQIMTYIIVAVMALSVTWEFLELFSNTVLGTNLIRNPSDTVLDLLLDLLGALMAMAFVYFQLKKRSPEEIARSMMKMYNICHKPQVL